MWILDHSENESVRTISYVLNMIVFMRNILQILC